MKKINLGFVLNFNKNSWQGGSVYLSNLIKQIKKNSKVINPVILTNYKLSNKDISEFNKIKIINSKLFSQNLIYRIINKILIIIFDKNFFLENLLIKNKIKILSHFFVTGRKSEVKSLFWIPDLQEIHNLKYINLRKKILRKINLFYAFKNAYNIILSSNTVKNDLKKIDPIASRRAIVFKPFFVTPDKIKNVNICKKYNIKKKFFLLPNQYWKHKNHILILKMLKELNINNTNNFQIISTGYFYDYRYPNYNNEILGFIKKNKLEKNYKILGIVPYNDLMDLMHLSIAVINPSKSEGWSSTVEQAKSMGKMVLLSNLAVHKEQAPFRSFYFNPNKKINLKKKIIELHNNYSFIKEQKKMKLARKKMSNIKKEFVQQYLNYIKKISNEKK